MWVGLSQPPTELSSRRGLAAAQAPDHAKVAVQLENLTGTGQLVKPVHILGHDRANQAQALKISYRAVPVVGPGAGKTLPVRRRGDEIAIRHGHHAPLAVRSPVVRDP